MNTQIIKEAGYEESLMGLSYSFKDRAITPEDWWTDERYKRMQELAPKLAHKGAGHNKFLRQMVLWVDIEAPRFFWSEFDTYKVGTVAQSESTMHTLVKRDVTFADFGTHIPQSTITEFNSNRKVLPINYLKGMLPEAYKQRRLVTMNYEVLNTIFKQRIGHRLPEWGYFIDAIRGQALHKELLWK